VSIAKLSSHTNVYQAGDHRVGAEQLRNGFGRLLQSIQDGNLPAAQKAYNDVVQTFPDFFKTLSDKLINDYKAIGNALAKGDITEARHAVVKLQHDLQSIGRTRTLQRPYHNLDSARKQAAHFGTNPGGYSENGKLPTIGANIDIKI